MYMQPNLVRPNRPHQLRPHAYGNSLQWAAANMPQRQVCQRPYHIGLISAHQMLAALCRYWRKHGRLSTGSRPWQNLAPPCHYTFWQTEFDNTIFDIICQKFWKSDMVKQILSSTSRARWGIARLPVSRSINYPRKIRTKDNDLTLITSGQIII